LYGIREPAQRTLARYQSRSQHFEAFKKNENRMPIKHLPPRLSQIYDLIGRGLRNAEIAAVLGLTHGTTKGYVHRLSERLGMDRYQMIRRYSTDLASDAAAQELERRLAQVSPELAEIVEEIVQELQNSNVTINAADVVKRCAAEALQAMRRELYRSERDGRRFVAMVGGRARGLGITSTFAAAPSLSPLCSLATKGPPCSKASTLRGYSRRCFRRTPSLPALGWRSRCSSGLGRARKG
jgi:FixJ family two-component response regulator